MVDGARQRYEMSENDQGAAIDYGMALAKSVNLKRPKQFLLHLLVWQDFEELVRDPSKHRPLWAIAETMIDMDEGFQNFRYRHLVLVKRIGSSLLSWYTSLR